jgi:serine/threonine-protein kinase
MVASPDTHFLAVQEALAGRYSLERELGRGGMGVVYLAHEVSLDRPVALKLLPAHFAAVPALRERFLREARTAAKLSHPHIVPIYAVDQVRDFVFFAMAYVNGETLGQRIRARGPLPASDSARMLREVAWALAYAHAQGVIHRDVKPDNILLEDATGRALVTDFGIAAVAKGAEATAAAPLTGKGEIVGTAEFMSPEQAAGEPVDGRSDLYSLGCVGYFALSGRLPFEAPTVAAILAKHLTQTPVPLTSAAPEAPARLARAVDRCLAKAPAERFATGEALAEALVASAVGRKELPVPLRVFLKRSRESFNSASGAAAVTGLMVVPMIVGTVVQGSLSGTVAAMGVGALLLSMPIISVLFQARRLAKAGYGFEDLRLAVRDDVAQRDEELRFEFSTGKSLPVRVAYPVMWTALASTLLSAIGASTIHALAIPAIWGVFGVSLFTFTVSGAIVARHQTRTQDLWGKRSLKFWKSRIAGWLYRLATRGAARGTPATGVTHRPTELAIGLAADRLFEQLPKPVRAQLGDLPHTLRRLETDAQGVRARIEELNALLAQAGEGRTTVAADRRAALRDRLEHEREKAEAQLRDAVTALETVRLNLLRMHAGVASVASVTADLEAAREVSAAVARLAEGQREVEKLLGAGG